MKIRIKFTKTGSMKFIGHLDIMRYFQKVMRRADVDIAYSEGFSPHQKMSFAAPLGVGLTSLGEYFDIEVHLTDSSAEMLQRINDTMVDGMKVISYRCLPEDTKNAMSIVAAADYMVRFREKYKPDIDIATGFEAFMNQENILTMKATKKSEILLDIKPLIFDYQVSDEGIFLKLAAGSENNLKPELVLHAFYTYEGLVMGKFDIMIERLELYGKSGDDIIPLEDFGEDIV